MHARARVESVESLKQFRGNLWEFVEEIRSALSDARSDIQRTRQWLEHEQGPWWVSQLRKRQELVTQAKRALDEKKLYRAPDGGRPSVVDEEQALRLAIRRRDEAERKLEAVKRWRRQLEREVNNYQAAAQRLSRAVDADVPNATITIDRLVDALEKYFALKPTQARLDTPDDTDDFSMGLPASLVFDETDAGEADVEAEASSDEGPSTATPEADESVEPSHDRKKGESA